VVGLILKDCEIYLEEELRNLMNLSDVQTKGFPLGKFLSYFMKV
jgi:hypothetical protein